LALLKHLNEKKEENEEARRVRENYHDKIKVETAVQVDPILDKIMPDELKFDNTSIGQSSFDIK